MGQRWVPPAQLDIDRITGAIHHPMLRQLVGWINSDPLAHAMRAPTLREARDFLNADALQLLDTEDEKSRAALLLEAAETAAACQETDLAAHALFTLFVYCDCIARHSMRDLVVLDAKQTVRLIKAYQRRANAASLYPAFSVVRDDDVLRRDGLRLFLETVRGQVTRKPGLLQSETAAHRAYREAFAHDRLATVTHDELSELRALIALAAPLKPAPYVPPGPSHARDLLASRRLEIRDFCIEAIEIFAKKHPNERFYGFIIIDCHFVLNSVEAYARGLKPADRASYLRDRTAFREWERGEPAGWAYWFVEINKAFPELGQAQSAYYDARKTNGSLEPGATPDAVFYAELCDWLLAEFDRLDAFQVLQRTPDFYTTWTKNPD